MSNESSQKLIVFDVDGTIVNSSTVLLAAFDAAFREQHLDVPDQRHLLSVVGLAHREMFSKLLGGRGPIDEMVRTYKATTRELRASRTEEPLYPGAAEALQRLAREPSTLLGLATGKSRRGLDYFLKKQGWPNMFITTKSSDDGPSKPHPAILLAAMQAANVPNDSCVMVGDSVFDIQMARAAGVQAIGVSWGYGASGALRAAGAQSVVSSFPELLAKLGFGDEAARPWPRTRQS